jgi:hypothetical protein
MNIQHEILGKDLIQLAGLLHKYGHHGQATVVDEIRASLETLNPDYKRLASIDMWGGSGAVWEVSLTSSRTSPEGGADRESFHKTIIRIAESMDHLKIGTDRSRSIAKIFREWLDKGIV